MWNTLLFAVIPYVAVAIAVIGGIVRYRMDRFSYSSQSSQFLESRALFWGSVFWHYGILLILGAHLLAVMFWDPWAVLVGDPNRLYTLEVIGLSLSLLALAGLAILIGAAPRGSGGLRPSRRRWTGCCSPSSRVQVVLGIWIALGYRWGSDWYVYTIVPWMHSLVQAEPEGRSTSSTCRRSSRRTPCSASP